MYFECDIRHLLGLHGEKQKPFLSVVFVITVTFNDSECFPIFMSLHMCHH